MLGEVNEVGVQPYLDGDVTFSQAVEAGSDPLREFMLGQTREDDLALVTRAADQPNPETREDVGILTLIPAFLLSELRSASSSASSCSCRSSSSTSSCPRR